MLCMLSLCLSPSLSLPPVLSLLSVSPLLPCLCFCSPSFFSPLSLSLSSFPSLPRSFSPFSLQGINLYPFFIPTVQATRIQADRVVENNVNKTSYNCFLAILYLTVADMFSFLAIFNLVFNCTFQNKNICSVNHYYCSEPHNIW